MLLSIGWAIVGYPGTLWAKLDQSVPFLNKFRDIVSHSGPSSDILSLGHSATLLAILEEYLQPTSAFTGQIPGEKQLSC